MRGLCRATTNWRSYTWNPELEEWVFDEPVEEGEKDGKKDGEKTGDENREKDDKDGEGSDKQYE